MKTITQVLTETVSPAFEKCGYDKIFGSVFVSDRLDLCQFQCNGAFICAKQYHKSPYLIASEIAKELNANTIFKMVDIASPGFINITLTDKYLLKTLLQIAQDIHLGIPRAEISETIVLDYGGPNVAKPLHIGHLRAGLLGKL